MTKLIRFLATCLLVFAMSGVALADGGETQGGDSASPVSATECVSAPTATVTPAVEQDSLIDLAIVVTVSLTLLLK